MVTATVIRAIALILETAGSWSISSRLQGAAFQKTVIFILAALRT
jgi:hypothetical protein